MKKKGLKFLALSLLVSLTIGGNVQAAGVNSSALSGKTANQRYMGGSASQISFAG